MALPLAQRRLIFSLVGVIVVLGMIVGVFVVKGNYLRPTAPLAVEDKPAAGKGSKEQEAVRKWLADNLDDPYVDEVRWWPAVATKEKNHVIRLKYRTRAKGVLELRDSIFFFGSGPKVTEERQVEWFVPGTWNDAFPD